MRADLDRDRSFIEVMLEQVIWFVAPSSMGEEGSKECSKRWFRWMHGAVRRTVLSLDKREEAREIEKIEEEHKVKEKEEMKAIVHKRFLESPRARRDIAKAELVDLKSSVPWV